MSPLPQVARSGFRVGVGQPLHVVRTTGGTDYFYDLQCTLMATLAWDRIDATVHISADGKAELIGNDWTVPAGNARVTDFEKNPGTSASFGCQRS